MKKTNSSAKNHYILSVTLSLLVILFIVGCSTESNNTQSQSEQNDDRIQPASQRQIETLEFGLIEGISISNIYTIKSQDFANVYFAGGLLNGAGVNNEIGIWVAGYEKQSLTMSINGIAQQFSDYPAGKNTDAQVTMNDEGASILENYLDSKK